MDTKDKYQGCIVAGAIGDAWGSAYENEIVEDKSIFHLIEIPKRQNLGWQITDDTQLTLITCEAIHEADKLTPESLSRKFIEYFKRRIIKGIGSSTLKSFQELSVGGHWSQTGRRGEYAAGNGAAMRIAPIAFEKRITRAELKDYCSITHHNDEAYVGALCVYESIKYYLENDNPKSNKLIGHLIDIIPDTRMRDRLIKIEERENNLLEIGKLGNNGYVVNSVPLAIAASVKCTEIGIEQMFSRLIQVGGDTDTNCSIAGQIAGTMIGFSEIPLHLIEKLKELPEYKWIRRTMDSANF